MAEIIFFSVIVEQLKTNIFIKRLGLSELLPQKLKKKSENWMEYNPQL